eukprot:1406610-Rhodomonas_salina.1
MLVRFRVEGRGHSVPASGTRRAPEPGTARRRRLLRSRSRFPSRSQAPPTARERSAPRWDALLCRAQHMLSRHEWHLPCRAGLWYRIRRARLGSTFVPSPSGSLVAR